MPENLARPYQDTTYDQHAKRLLSQRSIMARLLKRTVPEFEETSIPDIAEKYIEGTPQISEIPIDRDKTNVARNVLRTPKELVGDVTENSNLAEGLIRFDILFHARAPRSGELITLIINVEAQRTQRSSKLGYALLRRAVYYASRLISSQIEEELNNMCNLSTGIYEQGVERGIKSGMKRGMKRGMERGMERGMARGMECGREEGKVDIVLEMLRGKMPLETIAHMSKFSLERVKELGKMHSLL